MAFVHDEVVIEVDAAADLATVKRQVDAILVGCMREVCPDILIEVKGDFWRSWGKGKESKVPVDGGVTTGTGPATGATSSASSVVSLAPAAS